MSSQLQVSGEAKIRAIQGPVVANSGVITALNGGATQYVRGDGTLADFPTSTGGGSSVSYYLNSSVSQGTIGGVAYRQLSKTPISGAGTDIAISSNGYVASYITDANDPALLEVPAGNFNCEFYFSVNSNSHNPYVYAELYKYDGTTFTLLGSNVAIPEYLTNGTTLSAYYFAIPVAVAALTVTDRIAIRIYVNVDGRTVTLHTENNHLCQVVTTFSKGLISLNNLTRQNQFFGTGTSGTDFNISSATATHTFNIPSASATNRGLITTGTQTIAGLKAFDDAITGNSGIAFLNGVMPPITSSYYSGIGGNSQGISIVTRPVATNYTNNLYFPSASNSYTFPNATGTLALTTDISYPVTSVFGRTGAVVATEGDYSLTQLSDVTITTPTNGQVLKYNGTAWINDTDANTGTVTSVGLSSATSGVTIGSSPITTSGTITLAIATASSSQNGLLSSTDWTTFNNKYNLPSLTSGSVLFSNGTTIAQNNANFFWDNTNSFLGVGTNVPSAGITSFSSTPAFQFKAAGTAPAITFSNTLTSASLACVFGLATSNNHFIFGTAAGDMAIANQSTSAGAIVFGTGTTEKMRMTSAGTFSIGNTNSTFNLDVTGTGRFTGVLTLGSTISNGTYTYTLPSATGTLALTSQLTGGTVTSVGLSSATSGVTIGSSPITTSGTITLAIATASSSQNGLLSSTDWTTFNNKYNLPSLTSGSVLFSNGTTIAQNNANFFWDNTNSFLGVGTNVPSAGITSFSSTPAFQFKAAGTAPAITFSNTLTSASLACVFGLATSNNHFIFGTAAGDMAIANQSTSAGAIVFGTGTTEKMRMTSAGTFSIGNTNSTFNLDVTGTGRFTGVLTLGSTISNGTYIYTLPSATGTLALTSELSAYLPLTGGTLTGALSGTSATFSANANGVILNAATGTTNTQYKVANTSGDNYFGVAASDGSSLFTGTTAYSAYLGTNNARSLHLVTNGTVRQTIDSTGAATFSSSVSLSSLVATPSYGSGSVGINLGYTNIQNVVGNQACYANNIFYDGSNWKSISSTIAYAQGIRLQNGNIDFHNASVTTSNQTMSNWDTTDLKMRITLDGNFGLGTTSPNLYGLGSSAKSLQVTGSSYGIINANAGTCTAWLIADTTEAATGTSSNHPFKITTNNTERMRITSGGNVLIGQTTASGSVDGIYLRKGIESGIIVTSDIALQLSRLGTTGDIQSFYSGTTKVGSISVTGSTTAYNTSSDYRLKQDYKDYNGLYLINAIKTYDFEFKANNSRMYGVLAHELSEVIPYAVTGEKDAKEMQSVDYSKIVPVLVKAVQELSAQIEELKALIAAK